MSFITLDLSGRIRIFKRYKVIFLESLEIQFSFKKNTKKNDFS